MTGYRFRPQARRDLTAIFDRGVAQWGRAQAVRYQTDLIAKIELLAEFPNISRRLDWVHPVVRVHPHGAHIIVIRDDETAFLDILRIIHARQNLLDEIEGNPSGL
ncbi:hypothetical protein ATO6_20170 [Oceanicola sp. 22II-s10i]|uniref:type II toxin-antitoxin system RelE/ParE family toxin n=1 Tax=Oceanicola sp. 22II-s10i TaxID=1317116 RepID=UPI000B5292AE|nr:type II toxin-antitoxin system RelE/ParE family toxin [Oceanicola sp. 22II-s10i]OWU83162.1 hypothetical protein ATO6_20170 [Oceanicola sp. 22II-s10i]